MIDAVIISDLHTGGYCTRAKDVLAFLRNLPKADKLILNGDTTDASAGLSFPEDEVEIFATLGNIHTSGCQVLRIPGNHDPSLEKWSSVLCVTPAPSEVIVESGGKKFLVTHGHQWDPLCNHQGPFHGFGARCARLAGRFISRRFGRWLRYMTSKRAEESVLVGAIKRAEELGCSAAICGHTHKAEDVFHYVNEGSWCENVPPTYAVIEDGQARLETLGKEVRLK